MIDRQFVPVRVDADRQPDVNERYNLGGWPTTVFLTSSGAILSGATYLDAAQMMTALHRVSDAYPAVRSGRLPASAEATAGLGKARGNQASDGGQPDRDPPDPVGTIDHFRSLLLDRFDPVDGGFGASPKFPHPYALLFHCRCPKTRTCLVWSISRSSAECIMGSDSRRLLSIRGSAAEPSGTEKTLDATPRFFTSTSRPPSGPRRLTGPCRRHRPLGSKRDVGSGERRLYNAQTSRGVDDSMYVDSKRDDGPGLSYAPRRCSTTLAPRFRIEIARSDRRPYLHTR